MEQIITTHKNTDFDALASLVAASLLYPEAVPVLPRQTNPNVKSFLSFHKDIFEFPRVDQVDLGLTRRLIVVDTNAWCRLDRFDSLKKRDNLIVEVWDHHPDGGDLQPAVSHCEATGANITLLIRALRERRTLITPVQATLFLAGLYEDTGNLSFPSTCAEDAFAAGYLLDRKADLSVVNRFLSPAYGLKQKEVLFELLKSARRKKINGYRIGFGKLTVKGHVESLAVVVRMYLDIVNVDAAFGLFETGGQGKCIVIGRSAVEGLNIGSIMWTPGGRQRHVERCQAGCRGGHDYRIDPGQPAGLGPGQRSDVLPGDLRGGGDADVRSGPVAAQKRVYGTAGALQRKTGGRVVPP